MMFVLPDWTMELERKLDKVIQDIAVKHHIDLMAIKDSRAIKSGKYSISDTLVRLYENYDVETRKRLEEFEKDIKKTKKVVKKK